MLREREAGCTMTDAATEVAVDAAVANALLPSLRSTRLCKVWLAVVSRIERVPALQARAVRPAQR